MTQLALRPHQPGDAPGPRSVPVSVVVLTRDEELVPHKGIEKQAFPGRVVQ